MTGHRGGWDKWKWSTSVAGLLLVLGPASAFAGGVATGVLYEVLESPPAHAAPMGPIPGVYIPGAGERQAQATETGKLTGTGSLAFLTGDIQAQASSWVPFDPATWKFGSNGTVSGLFHVDGPAGLVAAKFEGTIDLSLLTSCPCPFAPTGGTWATLGKSKTSGYFHGVFLVPFEAAPGLWAYYNVTTGYLELVEADERGKDGAPLVKLLVTFWQ